MSSCSTPTPNAGKPGEPVPEPYPYGKEPPFNWKQTDAFKKYNQPEPVLPTGLPLHACMGLNSCAGSDRYGINGPDGKGESANDCAGQGYCATTAQHTCHTKNDCANQGGCGLYGWGPDMDQPGKNDCRAMGSCATPINAERFTTSGENRGKSVWQRAREVFEKDWVDNNRQDLVFKQKSGAADEQAKLPEKLGDPPSIFDGKGPSYLWISDDNTKRGDMTSCGASGLSGAGGCG